MEFVAVFLYMDKRLVGVDNLFEINRALRDMSEDSRCVKVTVELFGLFLRKIAVCIYRGENTSREITSHRHKINIIREIWLQVCDRAPDFCKMLMRESFVDRNVI